MNKISRQAVLKIANNKLIQLILYSPFLDYHGWSLLRFVKYQARNIKPTESLLDIGAGELRYKRYFNHCNYVSNDLCIGDAGWLFDDIDIKSTVYNIPVKNNSFDNILCTQVLEHLEFPELAFKEFNRILVKGGKLILTAPLGFGEHQVPYDYFRYTKYGLKSLGDRHNFNLIYIEPHGGVFINLGYMVNSAIQTLIPFQSKVTMRYLAFILLLPVTFSMGLLFCCLDLLDKKKSNTINYNVVYEKID